MGDHRRTSSVTAMLNHLDWPSLEERRYHSRLQMMYKIRNNLVDIPWRSYLTELSTSTRGHSSRFTIPHTNSSAYASSYSLPRTIRDWNNLTFDPAACIPIPRRFQICGEGSSSEVTSSPGFYSHLYILHLISISCCLETTYAYNAVRLSSTIWRQHCYRRRRSLFF